MNIKSQYQTINFRKHPYRNIFKDIGSNLNRYTQSIHRSYKNGNPRITSLVNEEIARRTKIINQNKEIIKEAVNAI